MSPDFSPHTGSTEFWLGSHHSSARCQLFPSADAPRPLCDVAPPLVEARRQDRPGAQVVAEAGTVLLRDLRTWCVRRDGPALRRREGALAS